MKQQVAQERQRRGVQPSPTQIPPGSLATNPNTSDQSAEIAKILQQAQSSHQSNGGGWTVVNQAIASNTTLTPASKQSLKTQWAQMAETDLHPSS